MLRMAILLLWFTAPLTTMIQATAEKGHICFEECQCATQGSSSIVHCNSLDFIHKLSPKELSTIVYLDVSNSSLRTLPKKLLKKLINLETFNLSQNRLTDIKHLPQLPKLNYLNLRSNLIKYFSGKNLPPNLETLDVSRNYIKKLPHDLISASNLKTLYIDGNSFSCTRESLDIRDVLLERDVKIIGHAVCYTPPKFQGKYWTNVVDFDEYFKLHNQDEIQADDPGASGEGSGQVDIFETTLSTSSPTFEHKVSIDNDFEFAEEGSGLIETEKEVTTESYYENINEDYDTDKMNDTGSGVVPPFYFGAELPDNDEEKYHQVTDNFVSPETTETVRKIVLDVMQTPKPAPDVTTVDSLEKEEVGNVEANKSDKGSLGTNIFLAIIIICLISLLVYAVKKSKENKRRKARQRQNDSEKQGEEMELLQKSPLPNEKQNGNPETSLLNGQNNEAENCKKDVKAGSENESLNTMPYSPNQNIINVKVKASEIPDSIPRTPILVDRQKSSDGQSIIITPNLNQRIATNN